MNYYNDKLLSLFTHYDSIVFFDFETTGFSPQLDDIIEVGAIQLRKGVNGPYKNKEIGLLVQLSKKLFLPSIITNITGITSEMLTEGVDITEARKALFELMTMDEKTLIVAHNAIFDLGFLAELFKNSKPFFDSVDVIDTLTIFRDRRPYPHKLEDAIAQYHLTDLVKNSHRALDDVNSLIEVLIAMAKEQDDIINYRNLIGYNPKYGYRPVKVMKKLKYYPHPYNMQGTLYQKVS